jgi:hypothetical protein
MSDYTVIRAVSDGLRDVLANHLSGYFTTVTVDLRSPREMGPADMNKRVSLWLYRVTRNEFVSNDPPARSALNEVTRWPLPVDLYYLVTPVQQEPTTRQELLGAVLQTFHDHSSLPASSFGIPSPLGQQDLRITLDSLRLEELTQVWYALQESYQLSVSYLVQLARIESAHDPMDVEPVRERQSDYRQILKVPAP